MTLSLNCFASPMAIASPLVSIMIPTFRRPELLMRALRSAVLQSTSIPFEIVVVDNEASRPYCDAVDKVVETFPEGVVRLHRNPVNLGMVGNWNLCIQLARSKWVSILSDDDFLEPYFLDSMAPYLGSSHALLACIKYTKDMRQSHSPANRSIVPSPSQYLKNLFFSIMPRSFLVTREMLALKNILGNPTGVLFDRAQALSVGGFRQSMYPSIDYDFWSRMSQCGQVRLVNQVQAAYVISINESLRSSTMEGFLRVDSCIRLALFECDSRSPFVRLLVARIVECLRERDCLYFRRSFGYVDSSGQASIAVSIYRLYWLLFGSRVGSGIMLIVLFVMNRLCSLSLRGARDT